MNKNPSGFIIILFILISYTSFSQDFNFYNPSNEMYLFSAVDEGANAFRYNPAVLGLKHKLNGTLNLFIRNNPYPGHALELGEYDFMLNSGILGLAYRHGIIEEINTSQILASNPEESDVSAFSLGLGFGNKTISGGLLGELLFNNLQYSYAKTFDTPKFRYRGGFGILYRPNRMISTAFTYKMDETYNIDQPAADRYTVGLAVRPLFNNLLTLMLDFGFIPNTYKWFFQNNLVKIGFDINTKFGFDFNASFARFNESKQDFLTLGLTYNFPNSSIRYGNMLGTFSSRNSSPADYKTTGSEVSFSFNLEKKPSLVQSPTHILEIAISGSLQDYTTKDVFFGILGKGKRSVHDLIADIDDAAKDPSVKGILMKIYPVSSGKIVGINAQIEELTNAMERFKSHGKKITAYFPQDVFAPEYYIGSFANDIVMPEEAMMFYGLSVDVMNFKQFLQKYGIELQTFHAGKYKLTYQGIVDSTTEEGKEVINRVLDIVYSKMMYRVSYGRNIIIDDNMREKLSQPISGLEAKQLGLIDKNGWFDDAKVLAQKNSGTDKFAYFYNRKFWDNQWSEPDAIAVVGVYAGITTGSSTAPGPIQIPLPYLSQGRTTGSETVVRQLEEAFSNPNVKAVILRVDSGGGSALASAEINAAIIRLKKKYKKPFIVSMGGAAASGGYYISTSADKIFADELTVTGSIGVFTARPNIDSLIQNQKIKVETFKRGEHSDIGTIYRKLDSTEIKIIQNLIDFYYDKFIESVSNGRKISKQEAEEVAQGRVWLGTDAFNKKLVDEIGGLYEALKYAKKKGKVGSRMKLIYYEVPGGERVSDIVTASLIQYFEMNLVDLLGFDDENHNIDIEY
ncbi:MAG: signal peptide peptidase SppA [Ignavibacteria bacterium]